MGRKVGSYTSTVESIKREQFSSFKSEAKRRRFGAGIEVTISFDVWKQMSEQPCRWCGRQGSNRKTHKTNPNLVWFCNGLDRLDNDSGYTEQNCVPCCIDCNRLKGARNPIQFAKLVSEIANHLKLHPLVGELTRLRG